MTPARARAGPAPIAPLIPGSPDSCSPIVACMPGEGTYLVGRAVGWDEGSAVGCEQIQAQVASAHGASPALVWGWRVLPAMTAWRGGWYITTKTAKPAPRMDAGWSAALGQLEAWSGHNIDQFLDCIRPAGWMAN